MAYVFRQGDLPKLDLQVDRGTDFKAWQTQWQAYLSLSGLDKQPAAKQVQALMLCFSRETVTVVDNLGLTAGQLADAGEIVQAIKSYVEGQVNESVERRNFRKRSQQSGESFDDFVLSLRELAKTCNFCTEECLQKNLRDQIITGLVDGDTIEALLRERNLTLATTIDKCRAQEAARKQRGEIAGTTPLVSVLRQQGSRRSAPFTRLQQHDSSFPSSRQTNLRGQGMPLSDVTCPGCGSAPHVGGRQNCPAFKRVCHTCSKVGHYSNVCRSGRPDSRTRRVHFEPSMKEEIPDVGALRVSNCSLFKLEPAPTIPIRISSLNGSSLVQTLPDSGADVSVAGLAFLASLSEHPCNLLPSDVRPRAVNGMKMSPIGKLPVVLSLDSKEFSDEVHVYKEVKGTLISWRAAKGLGILPPCYPHPQPCVSLVNSLPARERCSLASKVLAEFPSIFNGSIDRMDGEKFHITLADNAKPFCVRTPRTIPFAYREKLKDELELLQQQGIIAPVTSPTEWCAPIVVAPKKDSDRIRLCVDLTHLNKFVKRERYQSSTPAEAVADISAEHAKVFTKLDALKGYHQCPLDEESQLLTTFITPYGRFKYLRAPYGISSISEHYNRRMDEAFAGLSGYRRVVDDVVIYDSDEAEHANHVRQFLQRCVDKNITLNRDKCSFSQPEVKFAGFILSAEGYRIDTSIVEAILNFPTPSNRTDLRSFIGLVNQLSASTSSIASLLTPLRPLLSTKNDFIWSSHFQEAFAQAKSSLSQAPVLSYFDPRKPTRLCTDASRQGLGFILQQKTGDKWTLVQAGSRFLSDTETRYAIIELEMLAVVWAVIKCNIFLAGLPHFSILTDHHPLISILNNHRLDEIENPRLQRLKTKIMSYGFTAEWVKGSLNHGPDALSRNPVSDPQPSEILAERDHDDHMAMTVAEIRTVSAGQQESIRMQDLHRHAMEDNTYQQLKHYVQDGFPAHRSQLPEGCRPFWGIRDHLTLEDDLVLYGCRLVIPYQMRRDVLKELHNSHQGFVRTKQRAQLVVYWPGINNDIENVISSCIQCQESLPSHPREPIVQKPVPDRPFQELAVDFCSYAGHDFLVMVDCFSDWPDVVHMGHNTTTPHLIATLKQAFCRSGVPDVVWSDQGPQFSSQLFQSFAKEWGFKHITSTPRYPQSNGKAESSVKSMKKLIQAAWTGRSLDEGKLARSLLQYRNTPCRKDGLSPAQKLFGRPIQDMIPAHRRAFAPEWQRLSHEAERKAMEHHEQVESYYNQHACPLPEIHVGSHVVVQNPLTKGWDIYGIVVDVGPHRRYYVKTSGGRILTRNRRFLRRRKPTATPTHVAVPPPPTLPRSNTSSTPHTPSALPVAPTPPVTAVPLSSTVRRSSRPHNRTRRLIEEITFK